MFIDSLPHPSQTEEHFIGFGSWGGLWSKRKSGGGKQAAGGNDKGRREPDESCQSGWQVGHAGRIQ